MQYARTIFRKILDQDLVLFRSTELQLQLVLGSQLYSSIYKPKPNGVRARGMENISDPAEAAWPAGQWFKI